MKVSNFNDYYNIKETREFINNFCSNIYYSDKAYTLRKEYELEDYINECIIDLMKYWHTYNPKYSYKTFVGNVIKSVHKNLSKALLKDKRKANYQESNISLQTELDNADNEEVSNIIKDNKSYFSLEEYILNACNSIDNKIHRYINVLYYNGYSIEEIRIKLNSLTKRQIQYIIDKYKPHMKKAYINYYYFSA